MGNQDGVAVQPAFGQEFGVLPHQVLVNPLGYLKHVLFAFAQVFIFNRIKLLSQLVGLQLQRPFGIDGLRA